jgi:predicted DNA-binding antitoxin AbrB/MazE fold protein
MLRGLSVLKPDQLLKEGEKTQISIRNQQRGEIAIEKVTVLIPKIPVPKLDGTVSVVPDPRLSDSYVRDILVTMRANAQVTNDGVIFGGEKIKIGTTVDIEGPKYMIRGSTIDVRY